MRTHYNHPQVWILSVLAFVAACDDPAEWDTDADGGASDSSDEEDIAADADRLDELAAPPETAEAPGAPCRILALGDSITYGQNSNYLQSIDPIGTYNGGYRAHLVASFTLTPSSAVGPIKMVGARNDHYTPLMYTWNQRGHSGYPAYTNAQIADQVALGATAYAPHVILLHSGTNDMWAQPYPQHAFALTGLYDLLDELKLANPGAMVLMAKIIPATGAWAGLNPQINLYNAQLDTVAAARRAIGQTVYTVDHNALFPTATIEDGLHPNWAGYADMAARWRLALDARGCTP